MTEQLNPEVNQSIGHVMRPKNYLVGSIFVTIFCCLPLGVVGIVFPKQVNSKYELGDYASAESPSRQAKQFIMWGFIAGLVVLVAYFAIFGAAIIADINAENF